MRGSSGVFFVERARESEQNDQPRLSHRPSVSLGESAGDGIRARSSRDHGQLAKPQKCASLKPKRAENKRRLGRVENLVKRIDLALHGARVADEQLDRSVRAAMIRPP